MLIALFYAYILGGLTFIPIVIASFVFIAFWNSGRVGDVDDTRPKRKRQEVTNAEPEQASEDDADSSLPVETNDLPRTRKGWLTMRRTFEESVYDGGYVTLMRSFLDARSKDPKKSRPKDMWYVVLKGKVLFLYEDEEMTECEAAVELSSYDVVIYPEGLLDGELFARRNAICLKPKVMKLVEATSGVTKGGKLNIANEEGLGDDETPQAEHPKAVEKEKDTTIVTESNTSTSWFIFVRSNVEMEDWYLALVHASSHPSLTPTLKPLRYVFDPVDMNHLIATLDEQPDVIPMRWLNALLGRVFFSLYRTHNLESYIIGRLMRKLSKVKRPAFLTDIVVKEVSVGNRAPMFSKPMLKELTKEGHASMEVRLQYKGEIRITVEAIATINLGARFKSYTVKLVLAAVLKELEGNLLIKVKRPPSNRIWYAFTQTPRMVLSVEPIVSERQITWTMILSTIEARLKEIIQESVVMPNMDDIAFFESFQYEHRGGIWPDASRQQPSPCLFPSDAVKDDQSITSRPPPDALAPSVPDPSLVRSEAADPAMICITSPPHAEEDRSSFSASTPAEDYIPSSHANSKQRSWFSSNRHDTESSSLLEASEDIVVTEESRGRVLGVDRTAPSYSNSVRNQAEGGDEENVSLSSLTLSPKNTRRSASTHTLQREPESTPDGSITDSSTTQSAPVTPRRKSDASTSTVARTVNASTFFSTLKSRAGDKQALSNTAKEAMRKWGVNWGSRKKDILAANNATTSHNDAVDSGSALSQQSLSVNKRSNYEEVRAAVVERKEKQKALNVDGGSRSSSPTPNLDMPLPKENPTGNFTTVFNSGTSIDFPTLELKSSSIDRKSVSKGPAHSLSSKQSIQAIVKVNPDMDVDDIDVGDDSISPLIHVQPQAKTMSIPGIHASHRGEIMSMGYIPPLAPLDSKLINPAIQSVYRLWKAPATAEGAQTQVDRDERTQAPVTLRTEDPLVASNAVPGISLAPISKPHPPPLPPRSCDPSCRPAASAPASLPSPIKSTAPKIDCTSLKSLTDQSTPSSTGILIDIMEPDADEAPAVPHNNDDGGNTPAATPDAEEKTNLMKGTPPNHRPCLLECHLKHD